jgi:hypothetical protein
MKVFVVFLFAIFFTATLPSAKNRRPRALPLLVVCTLVALALSSFRLAS